MLQYPAILSPDTNGTVRVEFPDVPEVHTFGDDAGEALMHAVDALETALSIYIDDRREIPTPSRIRRGMKSIVLPALSEAKIALYQAMRQQHVGKAELARRLSCHLPQIDRLLDLGHASKLEHIERAFRSLGKRLEIQVSDAA